MSLEALTTVRALLEAGRVAEALMAAEVNLAGRAGEPAFLAIREQALAAIAAMDPPFAALQLDAAVNTDKPSAHLELGHAYVAREQWADAERCFRQALTLEPRSVEA